LVVDLLGVGILRQRRPARAVKPPKIKGAIRMGFSFSKDFHF